MKLARLTVLATCFGAFAQTLPPRLTLSEAEALALQNNPSIMAGKLDALAAHQKINQARSARFPFVTASATAVVAANDSRIAAGALNNPIIYDRIAAGVGVTQTIIDFGRTTNLIRSATSSAAAGDKRAELTRAEVLFSVRRAYYGALRAESVLSVARETVSSRQLLVDQVTELVKAQMRSSLDQSFAETNLAEAKLLVASAENERAAADADLAQALGRQGSEHFELVEDSSPADRPPSLADLRLQAIRQRPDLQAVRLELDAARQFSAAERAQRFPVISAAGAVGYVPVRADQLASDYAAGGVNVSLPFLNGGLYKARQAEAEIRARAVERRVAEMENKVMREVSTAWLDASTAFERIRLTRQFVAQASQALELAQARYDLGLSSIVEFSQAQLTKTNADLQFAAARYDYRIRRALLSYQTGSL